MSDTTVRVHTAVLSVSSTTGTWRLFVGLLNTTDPWPEHVFSSSEIPTPAARTAALTLLGYEPTDGAEWEWSEDTAAADGPVHLLSSMKVRERTGGAA
ncbi:MULTISPECIES: DUF6303 family protein [unclassified Streptomyces]|uniref:DUF6303 family protein n=1 Tax=unclassified Streptomyces TaxID=2593676 RepID=UPI0003A13F5E|nr:MULTISPECIES: DUF6303 family protein [unclassified Streptomyces]MYT30652.1 hypothetical protein [Streptomyces sp. SID8354]